MFIRSIGPRRASPASNPGGRSSLKYFINKQGKVIGPGTIEEMRSLLACHFLLAGDLIQRDGETDWHEISALAEFGGSVGPQPGSRLAEAPLTEASPPPEAPRIKVTVPTISTPVVRPSESAPDQDLPDAGLDSTAGRTMVSPFDYAGWELTRKTQIRLVQRITPAVYIGWALTLGIIWTLGYFIAVKFLEHEEQALSRPIPASGQETAETAAPETDLPAPAPARPVSASANEPRVQFRYQPANRSIAPPPRAQPDPIIASTEETPIFEAHLAPAASALPGHHNNVNAPMDVRNIPFRNYDVKFVQLIRKRWIAILEEQDFVRGLTGRVQVEFRLSPNGQVSNVQIIKNELNDLLAWLCQKAVLEGGPYGLWPTAMRLRVPEDFRIIRFTFYYE
jgi:hypothetical protein